MGYILIPSGTGGGADTSIVTATANDIVKGKVIVGPDGEPITGTMETMAGGTYTPTTSAQTIQCSGKKMTSNVVINPISSDYKKVSLYHNSDNTGTGVVYTVSDELSIGDIVDAVLREESKPNPGGSNTVVTNVKLFIDKTKCPLDRNTVYIWFLYGVIADPSGKGKPSYGILLPPIFFTSFHSTLSKIDVPHQHLLYDTLFSINTNSSLTFHCFRDEIDVSLQLDLLDIDNYNQYVVSLICIHKRGEVSAPTEDERTWYKIGCALFAKIHV